MYHLAAFFRNIDETADIQITALADGILSIQNSNFLLPRDMQLVGAAAMSATILNARLRSPKINQYNPLYIRPTIVGVVPPTDPRIADFADNPFVLRGQEELRMEGTISDTMNAENFTGLAWLADRIEPAPRGEIFTVRFTSSTAAVANAWTPLTTTLAQNLPDGEYAMLNSELAGASGQAHRWTFSEQYWRPGMLCVTAETNFSYSGFYKPRFGVMGRFRTYNLPRLEVLCNAATAAWVGYFNCVKVA